MYWICFAGYHLSSEGILGDKVKPLKGKAEEWLMKRKDALAPRWICGLFLLMKRGDAKVNNEWVSGDLKTQLLKMNKLQFVKDVSEIFAINSK